VIDVTFSLSQLQSFLAVVEKGSFSGAARALGKGQPAVSHAVATLETHLGVELFDRSGRTPTLTEAGSALLPEARELLASAQMLRHNARHWSSNAEQQQLALVVDMILPLDRLVRLIGDLKEAHPGLSLTVQIEARGAVTARLLDESCQLGVTGLLLPNVPTGMETIPVGSVPFVAVAAPEHPLAVHRNGLVPLSVLRRHTQLVLDDRSHLSTDQQVGVVGSNTWKIGNQSAKHRFLLEGFGWGAMPLHEVENDIEHGHLVSFQPANWSEPRVTIPLHIIYRSDRPLSRVAEAAISLIHSSGF